MSLAVSYHCSSYWFAVSIINSFSELLSLSLFRRVVAMSLVELNSCSAAADDVRDVLKTLLTVLTAGYDCRSGKWCVGCTFAKFLMCHKMIFDFNY